MSAVAMPAQKGKGKASRTAPSFADRVTYFPMNVEEIPNNIEREYLLGGTGRKAGTNKLDLSTIDKDDEPLPPSTSNRVMLAANVVMLVREWARILQHSCYARHRAHFDSCHQLLGISLSFICWFESRDIRNADEHCPLLYIGIAIGGIVTAVALLGFLGIMDLCSASSKYTILYVVWCAARSIVIDTG